MAESFSKITIIGNLGSDPEQRTTQSDRKVTSFSVAVNERRRLQDNTMQESTLWFRVSCWDKLGDIALQYLKKGRSVYIEGAFQLRDYIAKDGEKRYSIDITARDLQMLGSRNEALAETGDSGYGRATGGGAYGERSAVRAASPSGAGDMDDIPF